MFFYTVYGMEENNILVNDKFYTKEEYDKICKEAPIGEFSDFKYYSSSRIIKHLKEKYGFKELKYDQGFNVDQDVE